MIRVINQNNVMPSRTQSFPGCAAESGLSRTEGPVRGAHGSQAAAGEPRGPGLQDACRAGGLLIRCLFYKICIVIIYTWEGTINVNDLGNVIQMPLRIRPPWMQSTGAGHVLACMIILSGIIAIQTSRQSLSNSKSF